MEGVGARLGRSSSRYGTTTVFSGPVRKWKKDWVPIPPPSSSSNHHPSSSSLANGGSSVNGAVSHLRLFKWTPVSLTNNNKENSNINTSASNNGTSTTATKDSPAQGEVSEEPPRRKFKYIPVAALVEQRKGAEEGSDDEGKSVDAELASKNGSHDEKPDINDMPMEENEETEEDIQTSPERQDLNKSLDLSLG